MVASNVSNRYMEDSILTAKPEQLTLMLYNGCIKNMNIGRKAIEEKDHEQASMHLVKAQKIVSELRATLDFSYSISNQLYALYTYVLENLIASNVKKDTEALTTAQGIITELRDAWYQAMKLKEQQSAEATVAV